MAALCNDSIMLGCCFVAYCPISPARNHHNDSSYRRGYSLIMETFEIVEQRRISFFKSSGISAVIPSLRLLIDDCESPSADETLLAHSCE